MEQGSPAVGTRPTMQWVNEIADKLLLQRYEIRNVLGSGAMGEVLEVHDRQSDTAYALKRLPPQVAHDQSQLLLIRHNYGLVSQLTHPHIATTRFLEHDPGSNQVYLIMDLVRGETLADWVVKRRLELGDPQHPLDAEMTLAVAEQIASALDYAHSQPIARAPDGRPKRHGVLHRDLKPSNVMVELNREYRAKYPYVRLVDFGLAAEIQASMKNLSVVGQNIVCGTPAYMAPEQWAGRTLTRAVDQWALAVTVYEMLAGRRPFEGPTLEVLERRVMAAELEKPDVVSEAQWAVFQRAFDKDRKNRWPSCTEFVRALADADSRTLGLVQLPAPSIPDDELATGSAAPGQPSTRIVAVTAAWPATAPQVKRKWPWAVVAVLALAAAGAGVWFYFWRAEENQVRADIQQVLQDAGAGRLASGAALDQCLTRLDDLSRKYAARPPGDLAEVSRLAGELNARREGLKDRQKTFERLVKEAQDLLPQDVDESLRRLGEAERAGEADASRNFPSLLLGLSPSLGERRQEALAWRRLNLALKDALAARERKDWRQVVAALAEPLQAAALQNHPRLKESQDLLEQARATVARFGQHLDEGLALLKAEKFPEAERAFGQAREAWPEAPEARDIDARLKDAHDGTARKRYDAALSAAKKALEERRFAAAEEQFRAALADRANDPAASKGLEDARCGGWLEQAEKALQDQHWSDAETLFQKVLQLRAGDEAARKGAGEARYGRAVLAGKEALTARRWDEAEAEFAKAQQERPKDAAASQGALAVRYGRALEQGSQALAQNQWGAAKVGFEKALAEKPGDADALAGLSQVRYRNAMEEGQNLLFQKRWDQAELSFQAALKERSTDAEAAQGLEKIRAGRTQDAYATSMKDGQEALALKQWDRAINCLEEALRLKPDAPGVAALLTSAREGKAQSLIKHAEFNLSATSDWSGPNLQVEAGDLITVRAEGRWMVMGLFNQPTDASGRGSPAMWRLVDTDGEGHVLFQTTLIGRIGGGAPFYVGKDRQLRAPAAGRLQFRINVCLEAPLGRNSGAQNITIEVVPAAQSAGVEPRPVREEDLPSRGLMRKR